MNVLNNNHKELLDNLSIDEKRKLVKCAHGKERQELLLLIPEGEKLCRELPNEEFFYTLKEIGEEDSELLLTYGSNEQIQFVLDMELWQKDLIEPERIYKWFPLVTKDNMEKSVRFFREGDAKFLLSIFYYLIRVKTLPEDMDPLESDLPPFTLDGVYHIEFICPPSCEALVMQNLKTMLNSDKELYYFIMESMPFQLESDLVETSYQDKVRRLEYDGIPVFEDALSIYAPLDINEINEWEKKEPTAAPSPSYPMSIEKEDCLFRKAFNITQVSTQDRMQLELAVVGNKLMVADSLDPADLTNLSKTFKKALNIINIALQILSGNSLKKAEQVLESGVPIQYLFQLGNVRIVELRNKVSRIYPSKERGFYISLLGYPCKDIIENLFLPYPLFSPLLENKKLNFPRNFRDVKDISETDERITYAASITYLFDKALPLTQKQVENIATKSMIPEDIADMDYSSLLMTLLGNILLYKKEAFTPIKQSELSGLFEIMRENKKVCDDFTAFIFSRFSIPSKYVNCIEEFVKDSFLELREHIAEDFSLKYFRGMCVSKE